MSRNMARHLKTKHPEQITARVKMAEIPPDTKHVRKYRSWARRYCVRVGKIEYQCSICLKTLRLKHNGVSNMKRHIQNLHPEIYLRETMEQAAKLGNVEPGPEEYEVEYLDTTDPLSSGEDVIDDDDCKITKKYDKIVRKEDNEEIPDNNRFSETSPMFEENIERLCKQKVAGKRQIKSCFWNFFRMKGHDRCYECLFCKKTIAIFPQSVGNLKRHLINRHEAIVRIINKYAPVGDVVIISRKKQRESASDAEDFENTYFDVEAERKFKCKSCGEVIECEDVDRSNLSLHMEDKHPDQVVAYEEKVFSDEEPALGTE